MQRYIVERDVPGIGAMSPAELGAVSSQSNHALAQLAPDVQWQMSYVAGNKTFCVYLAKDAATIARHAELSGFAANNVTQVRHVIDPTTAGVN